MTGMYRSLSPTYQTDASRRDTHSSASAMACIDCTSACSHMSRCLLMPTFARFEARAGGWLAIPSFRLAFWLLVSPCFICLPTALSDRRFPRPGSCCPRQRPGTAGGCGCALSGCCCARDSSGSGYDTCVCSCDGVTAACCGGPNVTWRFLMLQRAGICPEHGLPALGASAVAAHPRSPFSKSSPLGVLELPSIGGVDGPCACAGSNTAITAIVGVAECFLAGLLLPDCPPSLPLRFPETSLALLARLLSAFAARRVTHWEIKQCERAEDFRQVHCLH